MFHKPRVAHHITLWSITHVMANAIQLDCQTCRSAIEIQDIWADWMLPSERGLAPDAGA
jgi:hypothetical protein